MSRPGGAFERVVHRCSVGRIVGTGDGCPRCYRTLDEHGRPLSGSPRVDLAAAFRLLADARRSRAGR